MRLKIRDKVFFAMLLANIIVVAGLYLLSNWSFNLSFKEYLDAKREKELAPLVQALSEQFKDHESWEWLEGPRNRYWRDLMDEFFIKKAINERGINRPIGKSNQKSRFQDKSQDQTENNQSRESRLRRDRSGEFPPPEPPNRLKKNENRPHSPPEKRGRAGPRFNGERPPQDMEPAKKIFLADLQKQMIVGRAFENLNVKWIEIRVQGNIVGFVGYEITNEITSALDQIFIQKLKENLSWSLLLVIAISALITLELARRFVKPIQRIKNATKAVAKGEYSTQIKIESMDEIGELSQDFNRLVKSLDKNLTARKHWIADISHELRTPVAILQGEIEAIQDGVRETNIELVNSLHQEIIRLSKLINDLHELSLSDSGALSYRFEKINLMDLIQDVFLVEASLIKKHQFIIEHHVLTKSIFVSADQLRLTQLFMNLFNNSLLYSDKEGVLDIRYKVEKKQVVIVWADSEPGVNDQQLAQLFERLYRAESSRNRNSGGSGLGLSISKSIVEAHNGSIEAYHSGLGGVEFRIKLPMI